MRQYTNKAVKFFFLDGSVVIPLLLVGIRPSWTTFYICIGFAAFLWILKYNGFDIPTLTRRFRSVFGTKRKHIRSPFRKFL